MNLIHLLNNIKFYLFYNYIKYKLFFFILFIFISLFNKVLLNNYDIIKLYFYLFFVESLIVLTCLINVLTYF